jgi:D-serine deaminase-like pyridoxal phosphate-dependent protein
MNGIEQLPTPALLVDIDRLQANIDGMARRAADLGVSLRPHVKTHKCVEIAGMQRAAGCSGITVSTLFEAEVFATAGFDDILWAFPVIPSRVRQARELAERVRLGVVVDSAAAVDALAQERFPFEVWVKVDCGYHRCGVDPSGDDALHLVRAAEQGGMRFAGLLSHSGDAYARPGLEARAAAAEGERAAIVALASRIRDAGVDVAHVSVGSTPAMTAVRSLAGVTEARPGNYVYFDRTQVALGSCGPEDCALTVVATVISSGREHSVIDAGALALSQDAGPEPGVMGELIAVGGEPAPATARVVRSLSQEHGQLDAALPVGTRVRILPNHSCLTAACFTRCWAVRGDEVEGHWRVWNGR